MLRHAIKRAARHPAVAVPLATVSALLFLSVIGVLLVSGGKPQLRNTDTHVVIISHDNTQRSLPTREKTVSAVLERAEVELNEGDVVEPGLDAEVVSDNFRINVYRSMPVTIIDGDRKIFVQSAAKTPRSIVKQAGIEVHPEDKLEFSPAENFLVEGSIGQRLLIRRANEVHLNLYGTQLTMRTQAVTVDELLKEKNIHLEPGDTVQPDRSTRLKPNDQVFVLQEGLRIEVAEEEIPMPEEVVEDKSLSFGTRVVRQQGSPGKRLVTYQVDERTGERIKIQEVMLIAAVSQVVARGQAVQIPHDKQAVMAAAGIAPSDYAYVDYIVSRESSWNYRARNASSGAYGLCQSLPASKMASAGSDWEINPVTQLKWCHGYAQDRYGSWQAAYNFWINNRWW